MDFVSQIHEFNHKADLVNKKYSDCLESSFQVEEALEGFSNLSDLGKLFHLSPEESTPKQLSRDIVSVAHNRDKPLQDVDRLDKACDAAVFAIGSMTKLGLTPDQINRALETVATKNLEKLNCPKDTHGKLTKPQGFVGPEEQLQEILNER